MSTATAQELLERANTAVQQGQLDEGEALLHRHLALAPNNAVALDFAARLALHKGDAKRAQQLANRAVGLQSVVSFVLTLAEATKACGDSQQAGGLYAKILQQSPNELRALSGLGEIYQQAGYRQQALELYSAALAADPSNAAIAFKYAGLLPSTRLTEALPILDRAKLPGDAPAKQKMSFLQQYILFKEWAERARHGLMPYHGAELRDSFFTYAAADRDTYERLADEVLVNRPDHAAAAMAKALSLFSRDKRAESQRYFKIGSQSQVNAIYDNIVFQPEFYSDLEKTSDAEIDEGLPPLVNVLSTPSVGSDIIYLSCNYAYFVGFARPMLLSLAQVAPRIDIHLHIMDGTDADWANVKAFCSRLDANFSISAERPNADKNGEMEARCYYHAIRFLRLLHHLKSSGKTLWLMDVDALINRDPRSLFAQMGLADVAFRLRPARWEPWNQYNASVIGIRPTSGGQSYLRLICLYIRHFHKQNQLRWGIDQLAMYGVFKHLQDCEKAPAVFLLNDRAVDYEYFDDGYVWCNSGGGKFLQLERIAKGKSGPTDFTQEKYFAALKRYSAQLDK